MQVNEKSKLEEKIKQSLTSGFHSEMEFRFMGENIIKLAGKTKDSSMTPADFEKMDYLGLAFRYVEVGVDGKLVATFVRTDDSKRRFD